MSISFHQGEEQERIFELHDVKLTQSYYLVLPLYFQDDLYLCSTRQPVSTRKPLDSGYQEEDYRYLYKIPWSLLTGGGVHQQPAVKNQR